MAITTLSPDSVASGSSNFSIAGGAGSINVALSDGSDSTYIQKSATGTASVIVGFGTSGISSAQTVRQIRLRCRLTTPTTLGKVNLQLGTRVAGANYFTAAYAARGAIALSTVTGPWYTSAPDGSSWDQSRIDALRVQLTDYKNTPDFASIMELFIDVDIATKPTTTVASPTGSVTDTATPDISWSFSDTDGDSQAYYEAKIFSAAQYGASTFNPLTSPSIWESGSTTSSDNTVTVGEYLANGTYRAYVRTGASINGAAFWSDFAYSDFTVSLTDPPTPSVTPTFSSGLNRVSIAIQGAAASGYDYQVFQLQRSYDNVTFADVRNAKSNFPNSSYLATYLDFEAARGLTVYYRARSIAFLGSNVVASAWSASASCSVTNDGKWWLKSISTPANNFGGARILNGFPVQRDEDLGIFRPIGRSTALVVGGTVSGRDGSFQIATLGSTEWNGIYALAIDQGAILVQDPFGDQKLIRWTARPWTESGAVGAQRRQLSLNFVEVVV